VEPSSEAVRQVLERRLDDPELFGEFVLCTRPAPEAESDAAAAKN